MNVAPEDGLRHRNTTYNFGDFVFDARTRLLFREGKGVHLTPKVLDVLLVLVEARGQLVEKDHLMKAVWPDRFVEDGNLTQSVSILRKILGENPDGGQYIETIPTRGYRLAATVKEVTPRDDLPPDSEQGASQIPVSSLDPGVPPMLRWNKRAGYIAAVSLIALAVAALLAHRMSYSKKASEITSIAVLPFLNLSGDPGNEYIGDGLTEEIISQLAQIKGLHVVARTSVFQFKNRQSDIRRVGDQLNAQTVLEGSVRMQKDLLRVTVQLNKASDGYHLWSHTYEGELSDVLAIEEEIAQSVVDTVGQSARPLVRLSNSTHQTKSAEAYDLYLRGLFNKGKVSRDALEKSIGFFKQAIALDPGFAAPHAGMSHSYIALGYSSQVPPKEAYPQAISELKKALAMDDKLSEAHADAAIVHLVFDWDWPGAKQEFDRAIELDPASGLAHHWYSHYFVMMNRFDASLAESRRALELEPVDLPISAHIGWHYLFERKYERAVDELLKSIELEPNQFWAWGFLRRAYEQESDFARAITVLERSKTDAKHVADLRREFAKDGAEGYWRVRLADALAQSRQHYVQPCYIAQLFVHLRDWNRAFEWMNKGYEVRDSWLIYLKVDPVWDPIRSDPRFADLIRKVGIT